MRVPIGRALGPELKLSKMPYSTFISGFDIERE